MPFRADLAVLCTIFSSGYQAFDFAKNWLPTKVSGHLVLVVSDDQATADFEHFIEIRLCSCCTKKNVHVVGFIEVLFTTNQYWLYMLFIGLPIKSFKTS